MRGLFWRGVALALAGCTSWLLWHWPAPQYPQAVEFALAPACALERPERAMFSATGWHCITDEEQKALDACRYAGQNRLPLPAGCSYVE